MDAQTLALGLVIALFAAACYSVTGFGFALVMAPLLALAWDVKPAIAATNVLATCTLLPLIVEARGYVDFGRVAVLVGASLAGIPIGILLLERLDSDALGLLISVTVIVASLLLYLAPHVGGQKDSNYGRATVGFVSGALGASTSMGGPPVVLYLLGREPHPHLFRATLLAYFLPGNLATIAAFAAVGRLTSDVFTVVAVALPGVLAGLLLGAKARGHIQPERFRAFVVAVLVVTALSVGISTIAGA